IGNCQIAVTAALWTGTQAWLLGARLYLPTTWPTASQRAITHIAPTVRLQEEWRLALTLLRQIRAADIRVTAVLADAKFGDNTLLRAYLHRAGLAYAVGISSTVSVFRGTPRLVPPRPTPRGRPRIRPTLPARVAPIAVQTLVATWVPRDWRIMRRRNAVGARPWQARFACARVTPAHAWRAAPPPAHRMAPRRTGRWRHAPDEVLPGASAGYGIAPCARATGASAVGD
ncbi:MAG: transposase, partial [Gemmatimonadaceae bacterium]